MVVLDSPEASPAKRMQVGVRQARCHRWCHRNWTAGTSHCCSGAGEGRNTFGIHGWELPGPRPHLPLRTLWLIERLNRVSSRVETQDYVPLPMLGLYKYIRLTVGQNEALELGVPGP